VRPTFPISDFKFDQGEGPSSPSLVLHLDQLGQVGREGQISVHRECPRVICTSALTNTMVFVPNVQTDFFFYKYKVDDSLQ
jgi:hypothetical protein